MELEAEAVEADVRREEGFEIAPAGEAELTSESVWQGTPTRAAPEAGGRAGWGQEGLGRVEDAGGAMGGQIICLPAALPRQGWSNI
jgi:hypothetical protein